MKIYVLGGGGVGSWLLPAICLLAKAENVIIVDGDKLEKGNLNRQLFDSNEIGAYKSDALAHKYGCESCPNYYSHGSLSIDEDDWLLVGVDNNPARMAALESCDAYGCKAILMANEVTSAEGYYYQPEWHGTKHDPRIYYPEIVTDKRFDPMRASIGCTGEQQVNNRQLVSANFMAAAIGQHLFVLWNMERRKFTRESVGHVPYRIMQNLSKYDTRTMENP